MLSLGDFVTHPIVLTVLALVAVVGCAATIWAILRSPTKADTDAIAQQIKDLESKVTLGSEYLDGLPAAVNQKLRAAYQEARILQLEGYEAQSADKHREAIDRFTRALKLAENDSQRAALHNLRGNSYHSISDYDSAQADHEETLKLADRVSPEQDAAMARAVALGNLGNAYKNRGELEKAEDHHRRALEIHREIGSRLGEAGALNNLGLIHRQRGDLDKAEENHKQALEIHRETGNRLGEANALGGLGLVYAVRGDLDKAEEHHQKALKIHRQIGYRLGEAANLSNLGLVYAERGELAKAKEPLQQSHDIFQAIGAATEAETARQALERIEQMERQQPERAEREV